MTFGDRKEAAAEFARLARENHGERIKEVILYGSVARGQDTGDSDVDILVISSNGGSSLQRTLSFLASDVSVQYGAEISVQNYDLADFERFSDRSFFRIVREEGIPIG